MTKFKVGDKVRIIDENGIVPNACKFKNGEVVKVIAVAPSGIVLERKSDGNSLGVLTSEFGAIELVSDKPTKNQRITTLEQNVVSLESEVAELKAKVEALEKAQQHREIVDAYTAVMAQKASRKPHKKMSLTPNEQRKAIIAEAKAFVEDVEALMKAYGHGGKLGDYGHISTNVCKWILKAEYIVDAEKRTVEALLHPYYLGEIVSIGIAKCAPDDVFNADIGKAIALGRALGLDVSRFEQAAKPTEVVVGQVVDNTFHHAKEYGWGIGKVASVDTEGYRVTDDSWSFKKSVVIKDDTEAVY